MGRKKISQYSFDREIPVEDRLRKILTLFELDTSAQILSNINLIAQKEKLSYYEFLDRLFEEELNKKEDLRIRRWVKQAKFNEIKSLDEYDFDYPKEIEKDVILGLANCEWIKYGGNVVFFGAAGVGKTHLSIALGVEAINQGYETQFIKASTLVNDINKAMDEDGGKSSGENRKRLLNKFMNIPLLILDDLAYSKIEPQSTDFLFQLLIGRYDNNRSTILTGNEGFEAWEKGLFSGNKAQAMAVTDRFLEDCVVVNIKGDSWRGKDAMKKRLEKQSKK